MSMSVRNISTSDPLALGRRALLFLDPASLRLFCMDFRNERSRDAVAFAAEGN